MSESIGVQIVEESTDFEIAELKDFFGTRFRSRKEPPTLDTGGAKKSNRDQDKEEEEKKAEASAAGDPADTFSNVGQT